MNLNLNYPDLCISISEDIYIRVYKKYETVTFFEFNKQ